MIIWLMFLDLNPLLNPNYKDFHKDVSNECLVYGSANAGKSYSIADKLLAQAVWQKEVPKIKIALIRKTLPSLRKSSLDILETRARALGMPFQLNKNEWEARVRNLQFIFCSLNNVEDFEKLKSLTDLDYVWINELPEIRERDYDEILRRKRGGQSNFTQCISDFNPEDEFSWVNDRFFTRNIGDVKKFHRTCYHNHPAYQKTDKFQREIEILKRYKEYDLNQYKIYFEGKWGKLEGVIFDWDIGPLPTDITFDEVFYGGDFGYTVDPAAIVKIYRKANEFWVKEILYQTGLTNIALGEWMKGNGFTRQEQTVFDSAEPKSIQELCDMGLTVLPAIKGPDSVRAGIDLVKSVKVHMIDGSENLKREVKRYTWKQDKDGRSLNVPIENNDHAIKATIYAIYTWSKTVHDFQYRAVSDRDIDEYAKKDKPKKNPGEIL